MQAEQTGGAMQIEAKRTNCTMQIEAERAARCRLATEPAVQTISGVVGGGAANYYTSCHNRFLGLWGLATSALATICVVRK